MSHFIGVVFGYNYEEALDRYDESKEVDQYLVYNREEAIEQGKKDVQSLIEFYDKEIQEGKNIETYTSEKEKYKNFTDDDYFKYASSGYIVEGDKVYSCYNPEAKWDWYDDTGGRWGNYLPLLNGEHASQALTSEIDWDELKTPFCFVDEDGEWHEIAEMGWWCMTRNDKEEEIWDKEFREYIETVRYRDILVTAVDFHI